MIKSIDAIRVCLLSVLILLGDMALAEVECYDGTGFSFLEYVGEGVPLQIYQDNEGEEVPLLVYLDNKGEKAVAKAPGTFIGFFILPLHHCRGGAELYRFGITRDSDGSYYLDEWVLGEDGEVKRVTRYKAVRTW
jgi:hypothetical protein